MQFLEPVVDFGDTQGARQHPWPKFTTGLTKKLMHDRLLGQKSVVAITSRTILIFVFYSKNLIK